MKKILTFLLVSCSVFSSYPQQIPGYLIYNNLQTNAAFAGQDSLSFNASAYINTEYLKSKRYRLEGAPYEFQLSISDHLKKINSGVGLFSSLESVGIEKYMWLEAFTIITTLLMKLQICGSDSGQT